MTGYPIICLLIERTFKAEDPEPSGYLDWHQWAKAQYKAGLRQKRCSCCRKWLFPQQFAEHATPEKGKKYEIAKKI